MTEADWNRCTEPHQVLAFLRTTSRASTRKLRLCAAACCRRIWHFLPCPVCQEAVRCAELYADGLLNELEREQIIRQALDVFVPLGAAADALSYGSWTALDFLPTDEERDRYEEVYQHAYQAARQGAGDANEAWEASQAALAAYCVLVDDEVGCHALFNAAKTVALGFRDAQAKAPVVPDTLYARDNPWDYIKTEPAYRPADPAELARQCDLLRDIIGNPFRLPPVLPSALLRWNDAVVVKLARSAYEDRLLPSGHLDTTRLAVLADALEEASCTDPGLLGHLRSAGLHVRGCWAVDLLLGRE